VVSRAYLVIDQLVNKETSRLLALSNTGGSMNAIETQALTKRYGAARGVEELNLAVPEGSLFGFIGPNGAGKSTTIRALLGLLLPTQGRAFLLGQEVRPKNVRVREQVGYVPSEVRYYDDLTVRDLLLYSASYYPNDSRTRREELLSHFELDPNKRLDALSLGNKKKVALVQALQHQPRLLILDEATSGLDPVMQERLCEVLLQEHARGTTIFFSSHILSEVQRLCQSVAILRAGRLVAVERVEALRARSWRRVSVRVQGNPSEGLANVPGVREFRAEAGHVSFLYQGEPAPLLSALAAEHPLDTLIEEPSLEEIVMGYYRDAAAS
jgi:ABC-2 type transport system ATP-binding protein